MIENLDGFANSLVPDFKTIFESVERDKFSKETLEALSRFYKVMKELNLVNYNLSSDESSISVTEIGLKFRIYRLGWDYTYQHCNECISRTYMQLIEVD